MDRALAVKITLVIVGLAGLASYFLAFVSAYLAKRFRIIDQPSGGRKIHKEPVPLLGGLGLAVVICVLAVVLMSVGYLNHSGIKNMQVIGFIFGILILLIGGLFDDIHPQKPLVQILFPMAAILVVIATGTTIVQVTNPLQVGGISMIWLKIGEISLPADILTFVWLLAATYSTKVLDGLDGLVTGLTVIGSGLIAILSLTTNYFFPAVGILSGMVGGAYFGFLPHNIYKAKQFLGESGATIAGFSLGVLAILSGAKIAIALAVLAIPMADVSLVIIGRLKRGQPWYRGDDTHLHFRLLRAGIEHRTAVFILWGVSLLAGILALSLQTRGKVFLVIALVVSTALASYLAGIKSNAKEAK